MKPGIISPEHLSQDQHDQIWTWLQANGVRHYVPVYSKIIVTGNRLIVPTLDIERVGQKNKTWARHRWVIDRDGESVLPVKIRTYRIRVPLQCKATK
ncbi:hypothetical protein ACT3UB_11930 [Glutamicibacter sp. AOP3-A1-12]